MIILQGENLDYLVLDIFQKEVLSEEVSDEVIIKMVNGLFTTAVWYQNITVNWLLKKILDNANYTSSKRSLDNINVSENYRQFNIWGKLPSYNNYLKVLSAVYVDYDNGNVYFGIDDELWYSNFDGALEKLCTIEHPDADTDSDYYTIYKIWKLNDYIYIWQHIIHFHLVSGIILIIILLIVII
jgi:hypothetical protein